MSAFIVSENHIRYLVSAALHYRMHGGAFTWYSLGTSERQPSRMGTLDPVADALGDPAVGADALGSMLWHKNFASVNARYHEKEEAPTYKHGRSVTVDPVQVLKAVQCYAYQSCEHDGWWDSSARAFCEALKNAAIHKLAGYDQAEWGL